MSAVLKRSTQDWQAADAAHFLHPFTDFQALAGKGSRIITRADNIYLWDNDGQRILEESGYVPVPPAAGAREP